VTAGLYANARVVLHTHTQRKIVLLRRGHRNMWAIFNTRAVTVTETKIKAAVSFFVFVSVTAAGREHNTGISYRGLSCWVYIIHTQNF
jgi:hypothetical protein